MSVITLIKRFIITNVMTVVYTAFVIFMILLNYITKPFKSSSASKVRLEPPPRLSDPKYGVHKYIKANNVKLHYVEKGDPSKPLMVFLHGFPEFWYSWRYQLMEFSKSYWCIAVDMRGYGDSERPEGVSNYKIELLAADIRDLVRQLGREKFILISHDWGGLVACKYRDTYPETLQAIVTLSSVCLDGWAEALWEDYEQFKKSWYFFFYRMPAIPEVMLQMNNVEIFDKLMLVDGKTTIDNQDLECFKYWFGKQFAMTPPVNYYRANFTYLYTGDVHKENIPFLYALGSNDSFLSSSLSDKMKARYTTLETKLVEGSGHFMQQEDPDKTNHVIKEFLQKHKF